MKEFLSEYDNEDNNVYDNGNSYDSQHTALHTPCDKNRVRVNSSKKIKIARNSHNEIGFKEEGEKVTQTARRSVNRSICIFIVIIYSAISLTILLRALRNLLPCTCAAFMHEIESMRKK